MRNGFWIAVGVSLLALGAFVLLFRTGNKLEQSPAETSTAESVPPLMCYCAAGIKPPVEKAVKAYEKEFGRKVELQYGGSGSLLASIETSKQGDLFVAADQDYLDIAKTKGLVAETMPLATQKAVLAVARGNKLDIKSIESLQDEKLRIGLANPGAAAVGKESEAIFTKAGMWDKVKAAVEARGVFKPTVTDLANDLRLGSIDVAIVWDSTVVQYPDLEAIAIDESLIHPQQIALGVLTTSKMPTEALRLARYVAARDKGLTHFKADHYQVADGDPWTDPPELTVYCGGMLRLATDPTLREFAQREGVKINTVYNGCGILVGQIKTGQLPDAYFACDVSFMSSVRDHFPDSRVMAKTRMVIGMPVGNPHEIHSLADLKKPGLKVGVCNPDQSALGALTRKLLQEVGLYDDVMKNVVSQVPTADLLVTQLRAGGLDAAIIYEVNYRPVAGQLEKIEISESSAVAVQPIAVCKESPYPQLSGRMVEALRAAHSHERFVTGGFTWLDSADAKPLATP